MEDELDLDLNENNQGEIISRKDKKINSLSEKIKLTSEERDALAKAKEEEAEARTTAEKERDFYKGFNPLLQKYPGASEYQDKILEKVNAGYDLEDATISILAKEGKYTPTAPVQESETAAGGSATTSMGETGDKPLSQTEIRAELMKNESELQNILFGGK